MEQDVYIWQLTLARYKMLFLVPNLCTILTVEQMIKVLKTIL